MDGTETRAEASESATEPATEPARRSDSTRAAILRAARDSFAAEGYERATIRLIAREAGIDPAMVMRYYGNKAGLFAASVEIDLHLPEVSYLPREHAGAVLVRHFLSLWEEDEALKAMLRVGATNPAGAEKVRSVFRDQLSPLAEALSPDPDQARTRAGLVASQLLGMALSRYVLELPPVVALSAEEVVRWLAPTVQGYLAGEVPPPLQSPE